MFKICDRVVHWFIPKILTWLVSGPRSLWAPPTGRSIGRRRVQGKMTEVSRAVHLCRRSGRQGESRRASWERGRHHKQPPPRFKLHRSSSAQSLRYRNMNIAKKSSNKSPFSRIRPVRLPPATWGRCCSSACKAKWGHPGPEPGRRWSGTTVRAAQRKDETNRCQKSESNNNKVIKKEKKLKAHIIIQVGECYGRGGSSAQSTTQGQRAEERAVIGQVDCP